MSTFSPKKKKILFALESLSMGGAEKALISLLQSLDSGKYDITLLLISATGSLMPMLSEIPNVTVKAFTKPENSGLRGFWSKVKIKSIYNWLPARVVGNYISKGNFDFVIAFCEGYLTKWIGSAHIKGKKIAWVHTDMLNNNWPLKTSVFSCFEEEKKAYQNFDEVVAVSTIVAQGMQASFGINDVPVIYNIVDPGIFDKAQNPIQHNPTAKLKLVSVGRLEYVKGYDRLIECMRILVKDQKLKIHLSIVGDGSQYTHLISKIQEYQLQDNVEMLGLKSNPYPYLSDSDIFVCPSRQEGFNIAILEAMTLGLPIISTDCAGPSEILQNGKYGILVNGSHQELAHQISRIYHNLQLLSELKALSKTRAIDFSAENSTSKFDNLLKK